MIRLLFIVFVLTTMACSEKKSEQTSPPTKIEASQNTPVDLPPGSVVIDTDTEGLKRLELRDASGNIQMTGFLFEGKRSGSWIEYHPDRKVKSVTPYVNGKKEGTFIELNVNGQFIKRCEYHNDVRHGDYVEFNYSIIKEVRNYQNGKLEGVVKVYYDDGKIQEEGLYKNGLREGVSKWYDQGGKVSIQYEYKAGELIKK